MPIPELVKALCDHAHPGSKMHEEIKGALSAALVVKITESIDSHERQIIKIGKSNIVPKYHSWIVHNNWDNFDNYCIC